MHVRRIPPGWEIYGGPSSNPELWAIYFYRKPHVGWNGRRIVFRWRGRLRGWWRHA